MLLEKGIEKFAKEGNNFINLGKIVNKKHKIFLLGQKQKNQFLLLEQKKTILKINKKPK
jgi:hypothetical protein